MQQLSLIPIGNELEGNIDFLNNSDCDETLSMILDFYKRIGFNPPWICYYASVNGVLVGSAGFKGRPVNGRVEIAYSTFKKYEGRGHGTEICNSLVSMALQTDSSVKITARTLPEENFSTRILIKNGFEFSGVVKDPEDGEVWEWIYNHPFPDSN